MTSVESNQWVMDKIFGSSEQSNNAELANYLDEIGNVTLDRLVTEPERLEADQANVKQETESLAFTNYKTFIQAANCSKQIHDDFTLIERHLDSAVERLPGLHEQCAQFTHEAADVQRRRALTAHALNKHSQLIEVLEIPQLMDSCVRAGYWEEALELNAYVAKLQRRLQHIQVIQSIAKETHTIQQTLVQQLVEQLNTQLSLPQCLKVVGFLRQLNVFTEPELRAKFLEARDGWLESVLSAVPGDDAYQHASKCMELLRVHLFDICTQYKAVFPDDDLSHLTSSSGRQRDVLRTNLPAIFHAWILHKVNQVVGLLEADVARGGGGRLDSLLSQVVLYLFIRGTLGKAMYFGASFGRIGADFRSHLVGIFNEAAWNNMSVALQSAHQRLMAEMHHVACIDAVQLSTEGTRSKPNDAAPPIVLVQWPALAVYCNFILQALNNERACVALNVCGRLAQLLQTQLIAVVQRLAALKREIEGPAAGARADKMACATELLCNQLVPHLNQCLQSLFPSQQLLGLFNLSAAKASLISFCRLDAAAIGACLQPPPPVDAQQDDSAQFQAGPAPDDDEQNDEPQAEQQPAAAVQDADVPQQVVIKSESEQHNDDVPGEKNIPATKDDEGDSNFY